MRLLTALAVTAVTSAHALPALAAGGAANFAGPRAELVAGYERTDPAPRVEAAAGALYGVGAGYDWQRGRLVAGPEVEITGSSAKVERPAFEDVTLDATGQIGRSLYAGVRAGFALNDRLLAYARGGFVNTRFELDPGFRASEGGWRIGGGGEWRFADRLYAKAEYRFSDYGADVRGQTFVGGVGVRF